ncbi:hypothetical protein HYPSUDRAFT_31982 [Hypholoma sublateritium FD-334 SS-4]|uniref:Vacuolar ATPase assembly integral membrane protein VMA21 n=1 Tax=Hypholoma sublateritium (strain FD-334 SS-4) TaxID=945553 RepID=A0A0D2PGG8_HYPSF|nr:hypothetical protein HYPSUDRAFT_31982 [Hypholoma sublateritium FD-334 SS-4]
MSTANVDAAAAGGVLATLITFSVSLGVIPIGAYFLSLHYLWAENSTYAAITAVVAANIILVCYIVVSLREDRRGRKPQPPEKARPESKKDK